MKSMDWQKRIERNPQILCGKAVVRGTRISVEQVLEHLAAGWTYEEMLRNFPKLSEDDVRACLEYATAYPERA